MKYLILIVLFTTAVGVELPAQDNRENPRISFVAPGASKNPANRDQFVVLVIEGPFISHEGTPIATTGVVAHVNGLLKAKGVSYIGVHIREGVKYGDVVRELDTLSHTDARNIGVSMIELPAGREP